jgi:tetratricopeptide (TPR) repeat protein
LKQNLKVDGYDIIAREHLGNLVFNLGAFYDRTLGSNLSVEYFLWALDVDPSNARIYFQLGKAFLNRGDKDKAQQFIQAGLELEPYNLEAKKLLEKT